MEVSYQWSNKIFWPLDYIAWQPIDFVSANKSAVTLTEWFQEFNSLACSSKFITTGKSEVPKWYTKDLKQLKAEFQANSVPGPVQN